VLASALCDASAASEKLLVEASNMGNKTDAAAPDAFKLKEALEARGEDVIEAVLEAVRGGSRLHEVAELLLPKLAPVANGMRRRKVIVVANHGFYMRQRGQNDVCAPIIAAVKPRWRTEMEEIGYGEQREKKVPHATGRLPRDGTSQALISRKRLLVVRSHIAQPASQQHTATDHARSYPDLLLRRIASSSR
jgi:hypothetical protein